MSKYDFKVDDLVQWEGGPKTGRVLYVDTRTAAIQRKNKTVFHVPQNVEVQFVGETGSRTICGPEQVMKLQRLDAATIRAAQGLVDAAAPAEAEQGTSRSRKRAARGKGGSKSPSTGRVPPARSEREATGGG